MLLGCCHCDDDAPSESDPSESDPSESVSQSVSESVSESDSDSEPSESSLSFSTFDPECGGCEVMPMRYRLSVPDLGPFNCPWGGDYVLYLTQAPNIGNSCLAIWDTPELAWDGTPPTCSPSFLGLPRYRLTVGSEATIESGIGTYKLAFEDWDCLGPNVLAKVGGGIGPTHLTVIPA